METSGTSNKPRIVYDGGCGFCRQWIGRWRRTTGDRIDYVPYEAMTEDPLQIPVESFQRAVHLIEPDGRISVGAHAVFRAASVGANRHWMLRAYEHVPGVAPVAEFGYRVVARHRRSLSFLTRCLYGADVGPHDYLLTRWLLIRLLCVVYAIAFVSLGVQILGLVGSDGILPAAEFLGGLETRFGDAAHWRFPTLAWLDAGDDVLQLLCWGGLAMSLLVVFRVAPAPLLLMMWAFYLSLFCVGQTFLSFQWDLLLLETGLLAVWLAPWKLLPRLATEPAPSRIVIWLLRWLLFRLMFLSGMVKLLDDSQTNPTWHLLTALNYHYETQPIPTWTAWYAHQLPEWIHKFSVLAMFVIEIGVPFLFLLPRRPRLVAFFLQAMLQLVIIATGNFTFFNALTLVLCISLLDDTYLRRVIPARWRGSLATWSPRRRSWSVQHWVIVPVAVVLLAVSTTLFLHALRADRSRRLDLAALPPPIRQAVVYTEPLRSINTYGLFRQMTTRRQEIIVEGSDDGRAWRVYEFKWKPGDVNRRPCFVAPHQPRLDWQMWFAALGNARSPRNRWFISFSRKLLQGSAPVLQLLETNPFPERPPRYLRATMYDYHFTDRPARAKTGAWWRREEIGIYLGPISLRSVGR